MIDPGRNRRRAAFALAFWACRLAAEPATLAERSPEAAPAFDILDFQVDGNSVLEVEAVETAIYPYLGPGKSIEDVEKAREALETAYRDKGYPTVLVEVPEQDVVQGVVRLQVVEGTVERLKIAGSRYFSLDKIREGAPALAEGKAPYMPEVREQIGKMAQESADRKLTPIFRAGSTPGKMEVELRVKDELPLHGRVEVNGGNTEHTTRTRVSGAIRYDNLWQRFHSASLQYQISPENSDELEVWSGTYVLPTGIADARLALYGVGIASNTQLGASVGGSSVVGTGSIYGLRLAKPLPGTDDFLHNLTAGFDWKDFDQAVSLIGGDTGRTPIRYASFMAAYDASLRGASSVTGFNLAAHFSLRGLGNDRNQFEAKRAGAQSNFVYFTGEIKHQQALPYDLRLYARLSGQAADSPLISNEQFALGGQQSVRGYHQTQQLGDHGLNASLELHSPELAPDDWEYARDLRLLTFVDWGHLWILEPLPRNPSHYTLASAGVGLRMRLFKRFLGEFDWGYPLYKQGTVDVGQQRVDFRMAYEF